MEQHSEDLQNVSEGDSVTLTTTKGETFDAECLSFDVQHADPRSGEVRQTNIWTFDVSDSEVCASILDGLKSSDDDPDFPIHSELWHMEKEETMGYIKDLKLHGQMKA